MHYFKIHCKKPTSYPTSFPNQKWLKLLKRDIAKRAEWSDWSEAHMRGLIFALGKEREKIQLFASFLMT